MRVAFINPRHTAADRFRQKCTPPLGLLYLTSALRRAGHESLILDDNVRLFPPDELRERLAAFAPDLVGLPFLSEVVHEIDRLLAVVRQIAPQVPVVIGGATATALPAWTRDLFPNADFVLAGEADHTIVRLVEHLQGNLSRADIPGLYWREADGRPAQHPEWTPIADLDSLAVTTRDLLAEEYRRRLYYNIMEPTAPIDLLSTTRGCRYACRFCFNIRPGYRGRSPENIVAEILERRAAGIHCLELADNTFLTDRDRALETFTLLVREKSPVRLVLKARAPEVDLDLCRLARRAGVVQISFGHESGSPRLLEAMNKRLTVADIFRSAECCRATGIHAHTSWIVGYPGETPETVQETIDLIRRLRPATINIEPLFPYPETPVYRQAQEEGTLVGEWGKEPGAIPWVRLPWIESREQLQRLVKQVRVKTMLRPNYVAWFGWQMLRHANRRLARYAWQEFQTTLRPRQTMVRS